MRGFVAFITTPEFLTGSFMSGLLGAGISYLSTHANDRRKAKQQDRMQARKEEREDKLRGQERLYTGATDFRSAFAPKGPRCLPTSRTSVSVNGFVNQTQRNSGGQRGMWHHRPDQR
jgi:hypothetical protein